MTYKIERDGFFFRAVNVVNGKRSMGFTSASQAGKLIAKIAGKDAYNEAIEEFKKNG